MNRLFVFLTVGLATFLIGCSSQSTKPLVSLEGWPSTPVYQNKTNPQSTSPFYKKLQALIQIGSFKNALFTVQKELKANPNQPNLQLTAAKLYHQLGQTQKALDSLTANIHANPKSAGIQAARGEFLREIGYLESAKNDLEFVIENSTYRSFELYYSLAQLYLKNKKSKSSVELAFKYASKALEFKPQHEKLLFIQVRTALRLKKYRSVLHSSTKLLEIAPGNLDYEGVYAYFLNSQGGQKILVQHFRERIKRFPKEQWYAVQLSSYLLQNNKIEEAILVIQAGLKLHPNNPFLHLGYAAIKRNQGNNKEALEHYSIGLKYQPKSTYANIEIAKIYLTQGKIAKAVTHLQKARALRDKNPYIYETLARILNQQEDTWEAERVIVDGLKMNHREAVSRGLKKIPYNPILLAEYGSILEKRGKYKDATRAYLLAYKETNSHSSDSKARANSFYFITKLGNIYRLQKNYPKALQYLTDAYELAPNSQPLQANLIELYSQMKEWDKALSMIQEMRKISPEHYWPHLQQALIELKLKKYSLALPSIQKAIDLNSNELWLYEIKGQCLNQLHRYPEAETALKVALKNNPKNAFLLTKLGYVQIFTNPIEADKSLSLALNNDESDFSGLELRLFLNKSSAQIWGFKQGKAEHRALNAIIKGDKNAEALIKKLRGNRYKPFLQFYHDYLRQGKEAKLRIHKSTKKLGAWQNFYIGVYHLMHKDSKKAQKALSLAYKQAPQNPWVATKLALAYEQLKDHKKAIPLLQTYLESQPSNIWAKLRLALNFDLTGQGLASQKVYLSILKERPKEYIALNNLAWLYATTKDPALQNKLEEALKLAEQSVKINATATNMDTLAEILYIKKDYQKALRYIQRALDRDRSNADHFKKQKKKIERAIRRQQGK